MLRVIDPELSLIGGYPTRSGTQTIIPGGECVVMHDKIPRNALSSVATVYLQCEPISEGNPPPDDETSNRIVWTIAASSGKGNSFFDMDATRGAVIAVPASEGLRISAQSLPLTLGGAITGSRRYRLTACAVWGGSAVPKEVFFTDFAFVANPPVLISPKLAIPKRAMSLALLTDKRAELVNTKVQFFWSFNPVSTLAYEGQGDEILPIAQNVVSYRINYAGVASPVMFQPLFGIAT